MPLCQNTVILNVHFGEFGANDNCGGSKLRDHLPHGVSQPDFDKATIAWQKGVSTLVNYLQPKVITTQSDAASAVRGKMIMW